MNELKSCCTPVNTTLKRTTVSEHLEQTESALNALKTTIDAFS